MVAGFQLQSMKIIDGTKVTCSRCDEIISLDDAVVLEKENDKAVEKPLCSDCLSIIGVPAGYYLERDISYLKR